MTSKKLSSIADLTPDPQNANRGTKRGLGLLDNSLRQYGAGRSILADKNGVVVAGNKTLERAADLGMEVVVVPSDGTKLIVVQRTDLDIDSKQGRELAYADNRVAQVDLDWNPDQLLADVAAGIDLPALFGRDDLDEILKQAAGYAPAADDPGADIDRAAELQAKWQTSAGQLWTLGRHKLLIGDATDTGTLDRLMDGTRAQATITDPPYNVGIDYGAETDDRKAAAEYEQFSRAWFARACEVSDKQIVTPGCYNLASWLRWFDPYHVAPWTKTNAMTNGKVSRWWCWEPVLFFGDKWLRTRSNDVFDYPIGQQAEVGNHPCPKPLTMWVDLVSNYTDPGAVVFEPFSGSGTTHVACEQTGRTCVGTELSPEYGAIILERLSGHGLKPVCESAQ